MTDNYPEFPIFASDPQLMGSIMSFVAIRWAFKQTASHRDKLVLLALANRANEQGHCWPSMKTIGIDCGMSRHTVLRSVDRLRKLGLISTEERKNKDGKSSHNYYLAINGKPDFLDVADCYTPSSKLLHPMLQTAT